MGAIVAIVIIFLSLGLALGAVAFVVYRRQLRRAKGIERGLKMVPLLIHLPPPSDDTEAGNRDVRDIMREKTSQAEVLYNLISGTATSGFKSSFYGQRHVALELIATNGLIHFYAAVPVALVSVVQQAIMTAYPGARVEEAEDHNIFNQDGRIAATMGGEIILKSDYAYPVATFKQLERDPLEALLNALGKMQPGDGAGIQVMLRPASPSWVKHSIKIAYKKSKSHHIPMSFTARDFAMAAVRPPEDSDPAKAGQNLTELEKAAIQAIEEKTQHPGYEVLIRVVVSTASVSRSQALIRDLSTAFSLFDAPGHNGFKFLPAVDSQGLVTAFIFRFFPPEVNSTVLNSVELATLYHLPDKQFTPSTGVERQQSKQVDGPTTLPRNGLLFGYNEFRGVRKEIRLSPEDRRRHTYILGQTGTGKSTLLENLAVQDMQAGNGFAFIDPHGDTAEKLLSLVPRERAEDVVYFNPADTEYPLGLNLFEFDRNRPEQKDFLIQETINMLYKLYDPNGTGVIGPRFEQWYRNAALTLMSDPAGATFIEIPKVFSDTEYLKHKFRYLKDPTVIEFWTKEMGQTSDYHKSEMLGYFVSKFGAFQQNEMMRNIIGQTESAFDLREIMDNKKILIINLSKGRVGELNSRLLGMIFVIKIQAAAMSRADMNELDRQDFSLYVDEFQNFSTDSFATILSEARKYRLNLIVANQFIGQLSNEIRDAVFGNIGTILAHRMGPEDAEFMVKQFAPVFDTRDLVNIPNFHSVVRLMNGGLPSQPFSMANLPALGKVNLELGQAMMQLSSAKYGMPRAQVEADIFARLSGKPVGTPAPKPVESAPAASTPAAAPANVPTPAVATPASASAPAAAPAPDETPKNSEPAEAADPSSLSYREITGRDTAAATPPAPIPDPAPMAPTPEPAPEPVPDPVPAPDPAAPLNPEPETDEVPMPTPEPPRELQPEPVIAPEPVPTEPTTPEEESSVEPAAEAPTVSALESLELVRPEPTPVAVPAPAATPQAESEEVSIHEIPLIPQGDPEAQIPAAEPVVEPVPEPQPVSEPDPAPQSEPAPEPDPQPKQTAEAPKVGRPNHTVKHQVGRPVLAELTPDGSPLEPQAVPEAKQEDGQSQPEPRRNEEKVPSSKPKRQKSKNKRLQPVEQTGDKDKVAQEVVAAPEPAVEEQTVATDETAPGTPQEAQDRIEKIIDPGNHLHLFPEKKEPPVDPVELEQAKLEVAEPAEQEVVSNEEATNPPEEAEAELPAVSPEEQAKSAEKLIEQAMKEASAALTAGDAKKDASAQGAEKVPVAAGSVEGPSEGMPNLAPGEVFVDDQGNVHMG